MRRKGVRRSRSSGVASPARAGRAPRRQLQMCSALRRGAAPVQEPVRAIGGFRTMESRGAPARRRHLIGSALLTPLLPRAPLRKWLLLSVFDFVRVRRLGRRPCVELARSRPAHRCPSPRPFYWLPHLVLGCVGVCVATRGRRGALHSDSRTAQALHVRFVWDPRVGEGDGHTLACAAVAARACTYT